MKPTRLLFRPLAGVQIIEAFNSYGLGSKSRAQNTLERMLEVAEALSLKLQTPVSIG